MSGPFAGLFGRGEAAAQLDDLAIVQAMLDVEVALLHAIARAGLAPMQAAEELAAVAHASMFDVGELGRSTGEKGTPVPALVSALRERVTVETAAHVHRGATSQDVVDTALMLVARRALAPIIVDLGTAAASAATLADRHRRTVLAGRTLLQQALPLPLGLKAAFWLSGLDDARAELAACRGSLAVQLGGAVGTLAVLGDRGPQVAALLAEELGLDDPQLPWHTLRLRPIRLAGALGAGIGVMGKIARDVALLAQTEVAEVAEGRSAGRGGSSTMRPIAKPGRRGRGDRMRGARARTRGDDVWGDGAGARAGRGSLAVGVGDVARAAAADRLGGLLYW